MKLLTKSMQSDISRQMVFKARDIDMCLINALDESMPADYLLDCLMMYQNKDGGFGNGLHIDNYNPNSSVYQVYEAFRLLDMLGFDSNNTHELFDTIINKAGNYLYNREIMKDNKWNPNTKTNDDFAHSFEYSCNDENKALFGYHPTIAILGYTLVFFKPTKAYYKKALKFARDIIDAFYNIKSLTKQEFISFNSFLNSIKKANVFVDDISKIEEKLTKLAIDNISLDFDDINAIHPLDAALYLNDPILNEKKSLELDYIIDTIAPHGLWNHNGDWGYDKYAEADSAMLKWIGAQTVNNYYVLKLHNRIEK